MLLPQHVQKSPLHLSEKKDRHCTNESLDDLLDKTDDMELVTKTPENNHGTCVQRWPGHNPPPALKQTVAVVLRTPTHSSVKGQAQTISGPCVDHAQTMWQTTQ